MNCLTFTLAGFAAFSRLGHTAYVINKDVGVVTSSDAGFACPDSISRLTASPVLAFLFSFALLSLGIDSQLSMMETVISVVSDLFPILLLKKNTPFTFLVCCIAFLLDISLCFEGGRRVIKWMNDCSGSNDLMIIALFETIAMCYVYGIKSFRAGIEMMIAAKSNVWCGYWLPGCLFLTEQNSVRDRGCCAWDEDDGRFLAGKLMATWGRAGSEAPNGRQRQSGYSLPFTY